MSSSAPEAARPRDRLSALPDGVLHRILRFLDARQAVGDLSLLSRRWRHLWATTPYVTLSDSKGFGDMLLLLRDGAPLRSFCLGTMDPGTFGHQRRWVSHALGRGLRVLQIWLRCDCAFEPPDCVFDCATLEEISLSGIFDEVIVPKIVCLPRLKKLHLGSVRFADPSVAEKLNDGCPVLEHLSLSLSTLGSFKISSHTVKTLSVIDCCYEGIHVSAPNTCSLRLTVSGKVQLDAMPSLVSAWVYVDPDNGLKHLAQGGYDLVKALCNAQQLLLLGFDTILHQDTMEHSFDEGLTFSKLRSLVIGELLQVTNFYNPLTYFLRFAPNLASLILDEKPLEQWQSDERQHYWNVFSEVSDENNPSGKLKLVSALPRGLERLRIRLLKYDDDEIEEEFHNMLGLLKEKAKPRVTVVVWSQASDWH